MRAAQEFGSHGMDGSRTKNGRAPPVQTYTFYFVKYNPYTNYELNGKLDDIMLVTFEERIEIIYKIKAMKRMEGGLDEVRKERHVLLDEEKDAKEKEMKVLEGDLKDVTEIWKKAYEMRHKLDKIRKEKNACVSQNHDLLLKASNLAIKKDTEALKKIFNLEVENFMSLWNNSKDFRDDYESRMPGSLNSRHLSGDGRMRNPGDKYPKAPIPFEVQAIIDTHVKRLEEDSISSPQQDPTTVDKVQKEAKIDLEDKGGNLGAEKLQQDLQSKQNEVDKEKLREKRRIAKEKKALWRKKKLAEEEAAKAVIKAQKEAEKKLSYWRNFMTAEEIEELAEELGV